MSQVSDSQSRDDFNSKLFWDDVWKDDFNSELFWDDAWRDYGAEENSDADFYEEEKSYEELHGHNYVARFLLLLVFFYCFFLFLLNCF